MQQLDSIQKRQALVERLRKVITDSSGSKFFQIRLAERFATWCTPEIFDAIHREFSLAGEVSKHILLARIQRPDGIFIRCTRRPV
jgi:hypothetical protein